MDHAARVQTRTGSDPGVEFARLYDREMPRIYRYLCYRVGSRVEAEDLTADVFQRALRRWPLVASQLESPRAWLFTIAANRLTDYYRQGTRPGASPVSLDERFDLAANQPDPETEAIRREEAETLLANLQRMSERDRAVLTLRFAGGLGHREIGQVLDISEGASAVALLRALRRLREMYEEEQDDE
ncbi:MAG: sigma-70 family RNA polymerase sigma factor [Anaerolineae bacterium]|nr:sigma-70 family RNA polymerase sigma factor [Anaerolineae bacterium]